MAGWFKVHRQILHSNVFDNPNLLKVWIWCLAKATYSGYEQVVGRQVVPLKPGQFVYGRRRAAIELGFSESTVRDYMGLLVELGNITIQPTNKFSVVTIDQWELYQSGNGKTDNKKTADEPTSGQQTDSRSATNKKVKKDKKVEKERYGEFVRLTEQEHQRLVDRLGSSATSDYIERLNNYIGSSGRKYRSHYHTILTWVRKDEEKSPTQPIRKVNFYIPEDD